MSGANEFPGEQDSGAGRFAPVIESATLPMVEVEGPDHRVCFVNALFCTLVGRAREEMIGHRFATLVEEGAECVQHLDLVYEAGMAATGADDPEAAQTRWLSAAWPGTENGNEPRRFIIQLTKGTGFRQNAAALNEALLLSGLQQHDLRLAAEESNANLAWEVAARRRIEADLRAAHEELRRNAERLERTVEDRTVQLRTSMGELEAFVYSLAHDLRAPVRAIHGFTQLALEMPRDEVGPGAAEMLQRVLKAATRMDSLIQDVLSLSQVINRPVALAPVDTDALVRSLLNERPEFSSPRAIVKVASPLLPLLAHEAMLSQCLTNLLGNAVKFVEPGATPQVRIGTEVMPSDGRQALVRLWVEDEGIGIPAKDRERIFEIFERLNPGPRYEGSGIGLSVVRKAAERMGGRCGVESDGVKGSRFWVELGRA